VTHRDVADYILNRWTGPSPRISCTPNLRHQKSLSLQQNSLTR